jgi:SAM-dependent methyltransferase
MENQVKEFYGEICFPGHYSIEDLKFYDAELINRYLQIYDYVMGGATTVLDIGCGSGFITNFLARRHPHIKFYAIDFSTSVRYAKEFSKKHNINNVTWIEDDFLTYNFNTKFDCIISNGVIHHIPEYKTAIGKIEKILSTRGVIAVGLYNKYGKIAKHIFPVKYASKTLFLDQEQAPFEVSFTHKEVLELFANYKMQHVHPSYKTQLVDVYNLFNFKNGGLTVYVFS